MGLHRLEIAYLNSCEHFGLKCKLEYIVDNMGADVFAEEFASGTENISFFTVEGTEVHLFRKRIIIAEIYVLRDAVEPPDDYDQQLPA